MSATVRDNPGLSRYEILVDDRVAGVGEYKLGPGRIAFLHTEIGDEYGGRGLARRLVAEALADARRRELAVLPFCPYVRRVIAEAPEDYLDLVPAKDRARFRLPGGAGTG